MGLANIYCPLCGEENKCMARTSEDCWCTSEKFPKGIFDLVPEESWRKHCICKSCLEAFKEKLVSWGIRPHKLY